MPDEQKSPMTPEEREAALQAREQALAQRERQEALLQGLSARGLPRAFSPFLTGMPDSGLDASLDGLRAAWEEAVSCGVRDRLRALPPASSGALPPAPDDAVRRIRAAMELKSMRNA